MPGAFDIPAAADALLRRPSTTEPLRPLPSDVTDTVPPGLRSPPPFVLARSFRRFSAVSVTRSEPEVGSLSMASPTAGSSVFPFGSPTRADLGSPQSMGGSTPGSTPVLSPKAASSQVQRPPLPRPTSPTSPTSPRSPPVVPLAEALDVRAPRHLVESQQRATLSPGPAPEIAGLTADDEDGGPLVEVTLLIACHDELTDLALRCRVPPIEGSGDDKEVGEGAPKPTGSAATTTALARRMMPCCPVVRTVADLQRAIAAVPAPQSVRVPRGDWAHMAGLGRSAVAGDATFAPQHRPEPWPRCGTAVPPELHILRCGGRLCFDARTDDSAMAPIGPLCREATGATAAQRSTDTPSPFAAVAPTPVHLHLYCAEGTAAVPRPGHLTQRSDTLALQPRDAAAMEAATVQAQALLALPPPRALSASPGPGDGVHGTASVDASPAPAAPQAAVRRPSTVLRVGLDDPVALGIAEAAGAVVTKPQRRLPPRRTPQAAPSVSPVAASPNDQRRLSADVGAAARRALRQYGPAMEATDELALSRRSSVASATPDSEPSVGAARRGSKLLRPAVSFTAAVAEEDGL